MRIVSVIGITLLFMATASAKGTHESCYGKEFMALTRFIEQSREKSHSMNTLYDMAKGGDTRAMIAIGLQHGRSPSANTDMKLAKKWLNEAADLNDSVAMFYLGTQFSQTPTGLNLKWLQRAAEKNMSYAQLYLAIAYYEGLATKTSYANAEY